MVLAAGPAPTQLDWHALAGGGRDDIFAVGMRLADEYGLAAQVWLEPGRREARRRGLPVVDHDFLDSFSLDMATKRDRYLQLLHAMWPDSMSGRCTRVWLTRRRERSTVGGEFVTPTLGS
jgi:chitin disaccharide deacetylase